MIPEEASIISRQLHKLKKERLISISRFSPRQNFALEWTWNNIVEMNSREAEVVILPALPNNYDRATSVAQFIVETLLLLKSPSQPSLRSDS